MITPHTCATHTYDTTAEEEWVKQTFCYRCINRYNKLTSDHEYCFPKEINVKTTYPYSNSQSTSTYSIIKKTYEVICYTELDGKIAGWIEKIQTFELI